MYLSNMIITPDEYSVNPVAVVALELDGGGSTTVHWFSGEPTTFGPGAISDGLREKLGNFSMIRLSTVMINGLSYASITYGSGYALVKYPYQTVRLTNPADIAALKSWQAAHQFDAPAEIVF